MICLCFQACKFQILYEAFHIQLSKSYFDILIQHHFNKALNGATAGCGPAHRIAPLAAFKNMLTNKLVDYARQEARITHYHPDAGNCSGVMVLLCRYLLEGNSWNESKDLVSKNEDVKTTWIKIENANFNNGGYVLDVMHSAFHFLDGEDALNSSLTFAGPANYCPVIVGVLQGIIDNNNNQT